MSASGEKPKLLVMELWGLGDLAIAIPFLRTAVRHAQVTLLAKPPAAPLLARFAPDVEHVPLVAPWTAFSGKYRLHRWRWRDLVRVGRTMRAARFALGASARRDPRDHGVLFLAGARRRLGFARSGSRLLLTDALPAPATAHRAAHWRALAHRLGWEMPAPFPQSPAPTSARRIVLHGGAGHPVRAWPRERFEELARRLRAAGHEVIHLDEASSDLDALLASLTAADRFIGNDSGPGHLAALLGVPTFTIFGPQLPELFAPQHPQAAWIEGAPCRFKPCFDACRFPAPYCLLDVSVEAVWARVSAWLGT